MSLCEVAVHYVPWWHADPRTDGWHGKGWTAWDLLAASHPRYEGHRQPPRPAWGKIDDTDPHIVAREIDLAADHGICSFLYHWYCFDDGPFLNEALDDGFLRAANLERMKFGIVWDNRDILAHTPAALAGHAGVLAKGQVAPDTFDAIARMWVDKYFGHPLYLKMDGCPFLAIYDLVNFVHSMGGLEGAREAIERLQLKAASSGFPGLHVMGMLYRPQDQERWGPLGGAKAVVAALGLDSVGPSHFLDHYEVGTDTFPRGNYAKASAANFAHWEHEAKAWGVPYVPNITVGFDASPRCCPTDRFEKREYPFVPVLEGNTPAAVRSVLEHARGYVSKPETKVKLVTVSSWNDWLDGASLLPDEAHGDCYLEMLKRVFAREVGGNRGHPGASRAPASGVVSTTVNSARPPVGSR